VRRPVPAVGTGAESEATVKRYLWVETVWRMRRRCQYAVRRAAIISRSDYAIEAWRLHR